MSGPKALMGTRAFGMIIDPRFNYKAMAYAPKTWIQEDPAQTDPDDAVVAAGDPQLGSMPASAAVVCDPIPVSF